MITETVDPFLELVSESQNWQSAGLGRGLRTPCARETPRPVTLAEAVDFHALAGRGCMDEAAIAEIDTDVRYALAVYMKKHQIAGLHFGTRNFFPTRKLA